MLCIRNEMLDVKTCMVFVYGQCNLIMLMCSYLLAFQRELSFCLALLEVGLWIIYRSVSKFSVLYQ